MILDLREVTGLNNRIRRFNRNFDRAMKELHVETGQDALRTIVRHSSGRPGPNIVTGQYVNSWAVVETGPYSFELVNDSPQKFRLEYGFYGTDALGRVYNQPPFPHIRPTMAEVTERYVINLNKLVGQQWRVAK